jgi:nucleotide-binding universal stress UspA family protein
MGADMVVMTTHGRGAGRIWLGSVADALVRRLPVPILLVRPQHIAPDLAHDQIFKHVLIPLDGSPRAEAVLEPAITLCSLMEARCTLLQAMDPLLAGHTMPPYTVGLTKHEVEQLQAESRAYLARMAQRLRAQLPRVQTHFTVAEPAAAIIEYAHEHTVDLIAMATQGRHLLSRMMLGSVAHQVIRSIGASVLLYRPPPDIWLRPAAKSELGLQGTNGCKVVVF